MTKLIDNFIFLVILIFIFFSLYSNGLFSLGIIQTRFSLEIEVILGSMVLDVWRILFKKWHYSIDKSIPKWNRKYSQNAENQTKDLGEFVSEINYVLLLGLYELPLIHKKHFKYDCHDFELKSNEIHCVRSLKYWRSRSLSASLVWRKEENK